MSNQCTCGSGLVATIYKNENKQEEKACGLCKSQLLYRIFENKLLDIFDDWLPKLMFDEIAPVGYEFQWQDLLEELNCKINKESNEIDHITINCPESKEYFIHVPNYLAEKILLNGF